jgi:signal transduction histidine kinase
VSQAVRRRDAYLPTLFAVLATIELIGLDVDDPVPPIALQIGVCALLVLRNRWPWAIPTVAGAASAAMPYLGTQLDEPAVPILIIGLASWTLGRALSDWRGLASLLLFELVILSDFSQNGRSFDASDLAFVTIMLMPPYLFGVGARTLVARNQRLAEQAAELLRLQETVRQEAAAAERGRIARELHDVIAHSVSAMVVQASAAEASFDNAPATARQAIDDIASTGRKALAETGRLLHLLRDDKDELGLAPDSGVDELPQLIEDMRRRGLDVELRQEGSLDDLPVGLGLSVYRIVQEVLTNALKHSGDRRVSLLVRRTRDALMIRAINVAGPRGLSNGLGLLGMAERVNVFGGTLKHAFEDSDFVVEAQLPLVDR